MATKKFAIDGIVPIIPTPFGADDQIDFGSLSGLIDFAFAAGAAAVCLPAYASEFYKLTEEEKHQLIAEAVSCAAGRIPVIGQVNHFSAKQAVESAVWVQKSGASAICAAVPRLFAWPERDLFRYFDKLLSSIELPLIVQDFNPRGPSLSPSFFAELHRAHPHLRYVKLEEARMGSKVAGILQATHGEVGVIEGWGGMYMLELIAEGICGVMPGLALTDLLARVFRLAKQKQTDKAYAIFSQVLPQIVFSLQEMELFHHAEKRLLQARGVLPQAFVREPKTSLEQGEEEYIDFLNGKILELLERIGLPSNPANRRATAPLTHAET